MPDNTGAADLGLPPRRAASRPQPLPGQSAQGIKVPPMPQAKEREFKWLTPELQAEADRIERLTALTRQQVALLDANGVTVSAFKILETKMEALVDFIAPPNTKTGQWKRLKFEAIFETMMAEMVAEVMPRVMTAVETVKSQLRQQILSGDLPEGMTAEQLLEAATQLGMRVPDALLKRMPSTSAFERPKPPAIES